MGRTSTTFDLKKDRGAVPPFSLRPIKICSNSPLYVRAHLPVAVWLQICSGTGLTLRGCCTHVKLLQIYFSPHRNPYKGKRTRLNMEEICYCCDLPATTIFEIFGILRPLCKWCEEEIILYQANEVFDVC